MSVSYCAPPDLIEKLGKVAVFFGGTSAEREVSLNSGNQVLNGLLAAGVDAFAFDFKGDLASLLKVECDRIFLALHGRGGEDGTIQGLLETMGVPYTGSGVMGSAIGMDKLRTKYLWQGMNMPTPKFAYVESVDVEEIGQLVSLLGFPLAVKPVREGSSIGISKVMTQVQLEAAIKEALKYDSKILLEQWIDGEEYTVGILNGESLPVIGLKTNNLFYDYEAKYESEDTEYQLPCGLSAEKELALAHLAENAFRAVGCAGWGRVDVMRDSEGRFWLLEVNTIPGMTDHSLVPMAAKAKGISFEELVVRILRSTLPESDSYCLPC